MPKYHAHFQDPCDCTFYECYIRAFVFSNEQIKTDFRNRLSRSRLDTCLRVREGSSTKDFEPDGVINCWWTEKERRLKSCPHNYPANKRLRLNYAKYVDLSTLTMSDLENSDDEDIYLIDIRVCKSILLLLTFRFSTVYKRLT